MIKEKLKVFDTVYKICSLNELDEGVILEVTNHNKIRVAYHTLPICEKLDVCFWEVNDSLFESEFEAYNAITDRLNSDLEKLKAEIRDRKGL